MPKRRRSPAPTCAADDNEDGVSPSELPTAQLEYGDDDTHSRFDTAKAPPITPFTANDVWVKRNKAPAIKFAGEENKPPPPPPSQDATTAPAPQQTQALNRPTRVTVVPAQGPASSTQQQRSNVPAQAPPPVPFPPPQAPKRRGPVPAEHLQLFFREPTPPPLKPVRSSWSNRGRGRGRGRGGATTTASRATTTQGPLAFAQSTRWVKPQGKKGNAAGTATSAPAPLSLLDKLALGNKEEGPKNKGGKQSKKKDGAAAKKSKKAAEERNGEGSETDAEKVKVPPKKRAKAAAKKAKADDEESDGVAEGSRQPAKKVAAGTKGKAKAFTGKSRGGASIKENDENNKLIFGLLPPGSDWMDESPLVQDLERQRRLAEEKRLTELRNGRRRIIDETSSESDGDGAGGHKNTGKKGKTIRERIEEVMEAEAQPKPKPKFTPRSKANREVSPDTSVDSIVPLDGDSEENGHRPQVHILGADGANDREHGLKETLSRYFNGTATSAAAARGDAAVDRPATPPSPSGSNEYPTITDIDVDIGMDRDVAGADAGIGTGMTDASSSALPYSSPIERKTGIYHKQGLARQNSKLAHPQPIRMRDLDDLSQLRRIAEEGCAAAAKMDEVKEDARARVIQNMARGFSKADPPMPSKKHHRRSPQPQVDTRFSTFANAVKPKLAPMDDSPFRNSGARGPVPADDEWSTLPTKSTKRTSIWTGSSNNSASASAYDASGKHGKKQTGGLGINTGRTLFTPSSGPPTINKPAPKFRTGAARKLGVGDEGRGAMDGRGRPTPDTSSGGGAQAYLTRLGAAPRRAEAGEDDLEGAVQRKGHDPYKRLYEQDAIEKAARYDAPAPQPVAMNFPQRGRYAVVPVSSAAPVHRGIPRIPGFVDHPSYLQPRRMPGGQGAGSVAWHGQAGGYGGGRLDAEEEEEDWAEKWKLKPKGKSINAPRVGSEGSNGGGGRGAAHMAPQQHFDEVTGYEYANGAYDTIDGGGYDMYGANDPRRTHTRDAYDDKNDDDEGNDHHKYHGDEAHNRCGAYDNHGHIPAQPGAGPSQGGWAGGGGGGGGGGGDMNGGGYGQVQNGVWRAEDDVGGAILSVGTGWRMGMGQGQGQGTRARERGRGQGGMGLDVYVYDDGYPGAEMGVA